MTIHDPEVSEVMTEIIEDYFPGLVWFPVIPPTDPPHPKCQCGSEPVGGSNQFSGT